MNVTTIGNRMIDEKICVNAMRGRFQNQHFLIDTGVRAATGVTPAAGVFPAIQVCCGPAGR